MGVGWRQVNRGGTCAEQVTELIRFSVHVQPKSRRRILIHATELSILDL